MMSLCQITHVVVLVNCYYAICTVKLKFRYFTSDCSPDTFHLTLVDTVRGISYSCSEPEALRYSGLMTSIEDLPANEYL
jgi:hypothetical protein